MHKYPSGPVLMSVIPLKPEAKINSDSSLSLSATLSFNPIELNFNPVLLSFTSK